jgi:hypothetical protein
MTSFNWSQSDHIKQSPLQWARFNGITDNGFNQLMGSTYSNLTNPKLLFHT